MAPHHQGFWRVVGALNDKKEYNNSKVPKISRLLPILKWIEAINDHLTKKIGCHMILLAYVVRPTQAVPVACPALEGQNRMF